LIRAKQILNLTERKKLQIQIGKVLKRLLGTLILEQEISAPLSGTTTSVFARTVSELETEIGSRAPLSIRQRNLYQNSPHQKSNFKQAYSNSQIPSTHTISKNPH